MQEINLYDLIKFYAKKWRLIVIVTLFGLLGGLIFNNVIQVPMFKSSSKLILVSPQASQTAASNQTLINNYIDLITSRRVLEPVIAKQNSTSTYEDLLGSVQVVNQKNTAIIDVTVTSPDAQRSAYIANEITNSFKIAVNDLYKDSGVIVVDPAVQATTPSNVKSLIQLALATGAGFVLSLIVLFFIYDFKASGLQNKSKKAVAKKEVTKTPSSKPLLVKKPVKKTTTKKPNNTKSNK